MGNSVQDQLLALEYHHPFAACYSVALDKLVVFACPTSNLQCCVVVPMPFPSLTLFSFVSEFCWDAASRCESKCLCYQLWSCQLPSTSNALPTKHLMPEQSWKRRDWKKDRVSDTNPDDNGARRLTSLHMWTLLSRTES